ncbi:acyltransferase family protein [Antarcticirhabdus aurantiaca]|uniref:Acyltransferase n=1 Tax=Antarcticirhabdus aurantiaca TaxID=2606717 RepID=A0ACD4NSE6_9HYPH|nr:acyltransferase [Antarcticirhabdus aurantiaca]WAJ29819.1 acyltransferase [Jeongeuplla avenae]
MTRINGFTALRLLAAVLVIFTHSYSLGGAVEDPFMATVGLVPASTLGVDAFFAISGFLICGSLMRQPQIGRFLAARALRILPALVVLLLVTVFVMGPLVTTAADYWERPLTFQYLLNGLLFVWRPFLPGVFEAATTTPVVNGSLWTLPMEAICYLVLALMAWCGSFNRRGLFALTLGGYLFFVLGAFHKDFILFNYAGGLIAEHLMRFVALFGGGALIRMLEAPRALSGPATLAAGALVVLAFLLGQIDWRFFPYLYLLAWPWFVVGLAFRLKALAGLDRFDVSYGLYLYAFPVQQVIVQAAGGSMPQLLLFAASLALTLVPATLSWFLVERPMLRLKPGRPDPRLTDPAGNAASSVGAFAIGRGGG